MERVRQLVARYKALFIDHDKKQTDTLKLRPAFYDWGLPSAGVTASAACSNQPR
jgi:hypothetical protein